MTWDPSVRRLLCFLQTASNLLPLVMPKCLEGTATYSQSYNKLFLPHTHTHTHVTPGCYTRVKLEEILGLGETVQYTDIQSEGWRDRPVHWYTVRGIERPSSKLIYSQRDGETVQYTDIQSEGWRDRPVHWYTEGWRDRPVHWYRGRGRLQRDVLRCWWPGVGTVHCDGMVMCDSWRATVTLTLSETVTGEPKNDTL